MTSVHDVSMHVHVCAQSDTCPDRVDNRANDGLADSPAELFQHIVPESVHRLCRLHYRLWGKVRCLQCSIGRDNILRRSGLRDLRDVLRLLSLRSRKCLSMLRLWIVWRRKLLRVGVDPRADCIASYM